MSAGGITGDGVSCCGSMEADRTGGEAYLPERGNAQSLALGRFKRLRVSLDKYSRFKTTTTKKKRKRQQATLSCRTNVSLDFGELQVSGDHSTWGNPTGTCSLQTCFFFFFVFLVYWIDSSAI